MKIRSLAVVTAVALATVAGPAPAHAGAWDDLGLPHTDRSQIHFRGNSMPLTWGDVVLVTADSALVVEGGLIDGSLDARRNRLLELPAGSGEPRVIGRRLVGFPMADPSGHRVFWTSLAAHDRLRLHAYDTSTGTSYRGVLGGWSVWAVDGDTAYLAGDDVEAWRSWTPGPGDLGPAEVVPAMPDETFLLDVAAGNRAFATDEGSYVVAPDGTVLASGLSGVPLFAPSGSYVALAKKRRVDVVDLAGDRVVRLTGLGGRISFFPRWSPGGELVVTAYLRTDHQPSPWNHWDDSLPVTYFRCAMPEGSCVEMRPRRLHPIGLDPYTFEPSALDQLAIMIGS